MLQREPLALAAPPCGRPGQAKACPSWPQEQKHKKRSIHVLHKPDSFRCFLQLGTAGLPLAVWPAILLMRTDERVSPRLLLAS